MKIEDGTGKGFFAKVTSNNEISARSTISTKEHFEAESGNSYVMNTADTANTLTVTATGGPILFIQNCEDNDIIIQELTISSNTAGIVARIVRNPILGTIGNNNVHTPVNSNFASSKTATVTAHNWDEVGDGLTGLTGGTVLATVILAVGSNRFGTAGSLIIPKGQRFSVEIIGASEITIDVRFFIEQEI